MLQTLRTMECSHSFSTDNDHDLDGPPVVKVSQSSSLKSPISSIDIVPPSYSLSRVLVLAALDPSVYCLQRRYPCYADTIVVGDVIV